MTGIEQINEWAFPMQKTMLARFLTITSIALLSVVSAVAQEDDPFGGQQQRAVRRALPVAVTDGLPQDQDKKEADKKDADAGPIVSTADIQTESGIGDQYARVHLWDGTIVGGEIQAKFITIATEFGELKIPVSRVVRFFPGLDSFPKMSEKLNGLVEQLGDKEFEKRESAHRELSSMGKLLRYEINNFDDGGSAERKKHLNNLKNEIEESLSDEEDFDTVETPANRPLIRGDTIVTPDFTVVGKIQEEVFVVKNKFGVLNVPLGEILMGDRSFTSTPGSIRKSVTVDGHSFFQSKPTSTRIRVKKGDKIQIRASGTVNWTNWGNVISTPDGLTNQGNWKQFQSGTLLARVGESGKLVKIGSKGEFVAGSNGVIYLAIAIRDSYANNSGYRWVGNYKCKVMVQPASK